MSVDVIGLDDIQDILETMIPREANNLSKAFIHGLAQEAAKDIKSAVPVDLGGLRKSIKAKRRRGKPGKPVADVIATQGRGAKHNGFYWRFLEHGTMNSPQQSFVAPVVLNFEANLKTKASNIFRDKLIKQVARKQKANRSRIK